MSVKPNCRRSRILDLPQPDTIYHSPKTHEEIFSQALRTVLLLVLLWGWVAGLNPFLNDAVLEVALSVKAAVICKNQILVQRCT